MDWKLYVNLKWTILSLNHGLCEIMAKLISSL